MVIHCHAHTVGHDLKHAKALLLRRPSMQSAGQAATDCQTQILLLKPSFVSSLVWKMFAVKFFYSDAFSQVSSCGLRCCQPIFVNTCLAMTTIYTTMC